jgi:plasmid maintenance system antidote protein VapI
MSSTTSLPAQVEVVTKHLSGATNTQIAKDLQMSRNTVSRILAESEIEQITQETKAILLTALPHSAETIARAVRKSPQHAWELLDRTGVMPKREGESQQINVGLNFDSMPSPFKKVDPSCPTNETKIISERL